MFIKFLRTLGVVFLVLAGNTLSAQQSFRPGTIETDKGKVLKGLVSYGNATISNPSTFEFKAKGETEVQLLTPFNTRAVTVEEDRFVGAVVDLEVSPMDKEKMGFDSELDLQKDTVFLRAFFEGEKGLYYLLDDNGKSQFYIKNGNTYELLTYKKYLVETSDGTTVVAQKKLYLEQLEEYLSACPSLRSTITKTAYTIEDLRDLFDAYYACTDEASDFRGIHQEARIQWGVKGGFSVSTSDLEGGGDALNRAMTDIGSSTDVAVGVSMDVLFPWVNDQLSLANDLIFHQYRFQQRVVPEQTILTTPTVDLGASYIQLSSMLRYHYRFGNDWSAFAGLGVGYGLMISENNSLMIEGIGFTRTNPAVERTKSGEWSGYAGLGVGKGSWSLELRGQRGQGLSDVAAISIPVTRLFVLAGYTF